MSFDRILVYNIYTVLQLGKGGGGLNVLQHTTPLMYFVMPMKIPKYVICSDRGGCYVFIHVQFKIQLEYTLYFDIFILHVEQASNVASLLRKGVWEIQKKAEVAFSSCS